MQQFLKYWKHSGRKLNHRNKDTSAEYANPNTTGGGRRLLILAGLLSVISCNAMAAEVEIRVVAKTTGKPLSDAAVCLGTTADSGQFGALLTSHDGTAAFRNVPSTPLVLTISKPGFMGHQRPHSAGDFDRVILVKLSGGGLGPVCNSVETPAAHVASGKTGLRINQFLVNGGKTRTQSRRVTLNSKVAGNPTHYRASEQPDLSTAIWKPYQKETMFQLSGPRGRKTIYFQVRRYKEINSSSVQSTSNIVTARISLVSG